MSDNDDDVEGTATTEVDNKKKSSGSTMSIVIGAIALIIAIAAIVFGIVAIILSAKKKGGAGASGPPGPIGPTGPTGPNGTRQIFGAVLGPSSAVKFWSGGTYSLPWYLSSGAEAVAGPTAPVCFMTGGSTVTNCFVSRGLTGSPLGIWNSNGIYGFYNNSKYPLPLELSLSLRAAYVWTSTTLGTPLIASIYPIVYSLEQGSTNNTYGVAGVPLSPTVYQLNPVNTGLVTQGYFNLNYTGRVTLPPASAGSPLSVCTLILDLSTGANGITNNKDSALQTTLPAGQNPTDYIFTVSVVG